MGHRDWPAVALLTNSPAPYRTPFFNELSKHCRLLVLFDTKRQADREWVIDEGDFDYEWTLVRTLSIPRRNMHRGFVQQQPPLHVPLNVVSVLNRFKPDVVVSSELGARTGWAAVFCGLQKRPLIVWWEGTPNSESAASASKKAIRRTLSQRANRAWVNGEESASSLAAYGILQSRIDRGMTGTDTFRWRREVEDARGVTRLALREQHGLRGTVIIFVGHLTALKGIPELLAALSILAADPDLPPWSALFVGSGPLTQEIEAWAEFHPAARVALPGFVQPSELAKYWAAADLFVMPSLADVWGLVCLEALVAGIPQVTSSLAGAAADLVTSSEVGVVVDPRNARSMADCLAHRIRLGPQRVPESLRDRATTTWSPVALTQRAMSSIHSSLTDQRRTR